VFNPFARIVRARVLVAGIAALLVSPQIASSQTAPFEIYGILPLTGSTPSTVRPNGRRCRSSRNPPTREAVSAARPIKFVYPRRRVEPVHGRFN